MILLADIGDFRPFQRPRELIAYLGLVPSEYSSGDRELRGALTKIGRGWVAYFRVGNAARCFSIVRSWVERKVRRHMTRARGRRGFGWKRWSRAWLHATLGLFADYRVQYWGRA